MLALMIVFCLRNSETFDIRRSNLNRSASIHVEPRMRFVLSKRALAGPIYRTRGSDLVVSEGGSSSHGPLRGTYLRNSTWSNSST